MTFSETAGMRENCFLGVLMKVFPRAERTEMIARLFLFVGAVALSAAVSLADSHASNVEGVWEAMMSRPNGDTVDSKLTIQKKDGKWAGTAVNSQGEERKLDRVSFDGKSLGIEVDIERDDWSGVIGVKAKLDDKGVLKGNWYAKGDEDNQIASGDWKAVRSLKAALAGTWKIVAKTDEEDFEHRIVFSASGSGFSGTAHREEDSLDFTKVTIEGNKLFLEFLFGEEGKVKVKAFQRTAKKMIGEWTLFDNLDSAIDSGEWVATK